MYMLIIYFRRNKIKRMSDCLLDDEDDEILSNFPMTFDNDYEENEKKYEEEKENIENEYDSADEVLIMLMDKENAISSQQKKIKKTSNTAPQLLDDKNSSEDDDNDDDIDNAGIVIFIKGNCFLKLTY